MIDAKEFAVRISGVEGTVKIAGIILDEHGGDRESATRALIHFLREDNGEFRRRVGNTLLEQFRDFAPKILIGALNAGTPEEESRRAFAKELLVSFGQQAVRYLVPCLGDRELRESASEVLIKIGKPSVNTLLPVLDNDDPERVSMVKKTLVGIGKPAVKPAIKAMFSPKHGIAETAQEILIAIGRDALPELRSEREKIAGRRKTMKR
ncbi:MAG: hypothetical protein FJY77_04105, partial [Candidatus Altiarchaeales archaeon]|nr:hypothetical protein [Candidatus Altiarchaeales archaeon]